MYTTHKKYMNFVRYSVIDKNVHYEGGMGSMYMYMYLPSSKK